jgi:uncharacterized surface protein with fasciclin (FAS1) repeats
MRRLIASLAAAAMVVATAPAVVAAPGAAGARPAAPNSIVDVAVAVNTSGPYAGQFDTLLSLVTMYPDLVDVLSSRGQYTVFAPTDAAFDALFAQVDPATLSADQIKNVLLYHVANGRRDASSVVTSDQIRMLNGDFTSVDGATINGADIIVTDVFAGNGVIHAINAVLLPPSL